MPCLSSLSVPYRNLAHWFSVIVLVQLVLDRIFLVSYFTTPILFYISFFVCMPISCVFPATWRRFCALLTPAWWDGLFAAWPPLRVLDMLSEDGMFQVFLKHILVIVPERLRLSMSQTHVQLSPRCHFPCTRCEILGCFWEKYLF